MLPEDWGMDAPSNVGKQGRKKDRAKWQKKLQEQEAGSDSEDWFLNPANARNRGVQPTLQANRAGPHAPKIMIFGASMKEAGRQFQPPPVPERPKLIDRIHGGGESSSHRNQHGDRGGLPREDSRSRNQGQYGRHRERERDRNKGYRDKGYRDSRRAGDRAYRREDSGPRYSGGYSR